MGKSIYRGQQPLATSSLLKKLSAFKLFLIISTTGLLLFLLAAAGIIFLADQQHKKLIHYELILNLKGSGEHLKNNNFRLFTQNLTLNTNDYYIKTESIISSKVFSSGSASLLRFGKCVSERYFEFDIEFCRRYDLPWEYLSIFAVIFTICLWVIILLLNKLRIAALDSFKKNALVEISKQVAHDIRSPLSTLKLILSSSKDLPDKKRDIVESVISQIDDIAENLLLKTKNTSANSNIQKISLPTTMLSLNAETPIHFIEPIISSFIREKCIQFNENIQFKSDIRLDGTPAIAIDPNELKRILSNLITNSVEAIYCDTIEIILGLREYPDSIHLFIKDNGKGIPKSILTILGREQISYGKENTKSGNGIGVFYAKQTIEKFNGTLSISSKENAGTVVDIILPKLKI